MWGFGGNAPRVLTLAANALKVLILVVNAPKVFLSRVNTMHKGILLLGAEYACLYCEGAAGVVDDE